MSRPILFLAMLGLINLAGCGYHVLGSTPTTSVMQPKLAIPLFTNRSNEVGLEAIFANALIGTFSQSKAAQVTTKENQADLILQGDVTTVENRSLAYRDIDRSLVRRVSISIDFVLKERQSGKVIWKQAKAIDADYVVNPDYHYGEATRQMSISKAAATLARRVHDEILMIL
ncbi:MAG: LPS assembly lipoprotein LptE [Desulfobacteraceae bacterium]